MKKYRSIITYLTVLFLVLNIGLVSAEPISNTAIGAKGSSNRILLCTSQGFIWVTISDVNASEKPFQSEITTHNCPLCLSNSIDLDDIVQPYRGSNSYSLPQDNKLLFSLSAFYQNNPLSSLQARAPPASPTA